MQNSSKYMAYDKDVLPSKNAVYIFSTYVQKHGSLLSSGRNSTIRIVSNYKKSVTYPKKTRSIVFPTAPAIITTNTKNNGK